MSKLRGAVVLIEGEETLGRNHHTWKKRVKELARKEKQEEKMKRRQGKTSTPSATKMPELIEEEN